MRGGWDVSDDFARSLINLQEAGHDVVTYETLPPVPIISCPCVLHPTIHSLVLSPWKNPTPTCALLPCSRVPAFKFRSTRRWVSIIVRTCLRSGSIARFFPIRVMCYLSSGHKRGLAVSSGSGPATTCPKCNGGRMADQIAMANIKFIVNS